MFDGLPVMLPAMNGKSVGVLAGRLDRRPDLPNVVLNVECF